MGNLYFYKNIAIKIVLSALILATTLGCSTLKKERSTYNQKSKVEKKSTSNNLSKERLQYIDKYKGLAIKLMKKHKIPASIILAQACLESGNGKSTLATKANNHFGIKCHSSWKGGKYYHNDDKKNECFRRYKSAEDSFEDHSLFLKNGKRYASLFDIPKMDYRKWAHGLKAAGYATNPKYAEVLIKIIEDYKLYEYDR